jgi:hypothetical protein
MNNEWLLSTLKEYLDKPDFFGKIELNVQNGQIITVNVTRSIKPPKK